MHSASCSLAAGPDALSCRPTQTCCAGQSHARSHTVQQAQAGAVCQAPQADQRRRALFCRRQQRASRADCQRAHRRRRPLHGRRLSGAALCLCCAHHQAPAGPAKLRSAARAAHELCEAEAGALTCWPARPEVVRARAGCASCLQGCAPAGLQLTCRMRWSGTGLPGSTRRMTMSTPAP